MAKQQALSILPFLKTHSEIAADVERKLKDPRVKGGLPSQPELDRAKYEREIWYELKERERVLEELNTVRYHAHALLDYLDIYVATVPNKEKYARLIRALRESLRGKS